MATPLIAIEEQASRTAPVPVDVGIEPLQRHARWVYRIHWLVFADIVLAAVAYGLVLLARGGVAAESLGSPVLSTADWSILVLFAVVLATFYLFGLYEWEVFVSRPLHLWTLLRALCSAFLISAGIIYVLPAPIAVQSRFAVFASFGLFLLFAVIVRFAVVSRLVRGNAGQGRVTLVVGKTMRTEPLRQRLKDLRGFSKVQPLDFVQPGQSVLDRFTAQIAERNGDHAPAVGQVFIDAGSVPPGAALAMISSAKHAGVEVYVVSPLLRSLSCRRLLPDLFEAPVVRVRRAPDATGMNAAKRLFDVVASALALVIVAPVMLAIAVAIKLKSGGPVIYAQPRIGRHGRPFKFYKFRSMSTDADCSSHAEYVRELIGGNGVVHRIGDGERCEEVYKLVDDPRVTGVGRFLRKYSLDELPQFWNVLRGDMSMVGPRPPLAYEVCEYRDWHRQRLLPAPGISGPWQVQGRSRVTFDEMVFQDVVYGCVQSPLVDTAICVRTIPAALVGRGAV